MTVPYRSGPVATGHGYNLHQSLVLDLRLRGCAQSSTRLTIIRGCGAVASYARDLTGTRAVFFWRAGCWTRGSFWALLAGQLPAGISAHVGGGLVAVEC
jgi:hypothetical protein